MKTTLFLLAFSIISLVSYSQQNYFVYLQTDNKQPFYIKLNEQLYSSSASGYLVIPKLQNGTHNFSVGFPKAEWPQQIFAVNINNKDEGYLLKNFNEKGWGLFNMQSLDVIMARTEGDQKSAKVVNANDGFSDILAGVVNTPGLNENAIEQTNPVVIDTPVTIIKTEPIEKAVETSVVNSIEPSVVNTTSIKKLDSAVDNDGRTLVYVDNLAEKPDTIRIFIANEPTVSPVITKEEEVKVVAIPDSIVLEKPVVLNDTLVNTVQKEPVKEPGFISIELPNPNSNKDTVVINTISPNPVIEKKEETIVNNVTVPVVTEELKEMPKPPTISVINSDCKQSATEEDFLKLRKKMASYDKDEDMVNAARKVFKGKCFSTEQVKNLSVLFLTDAGKYSFFDIAYPFVHDSSRFSTLQNQLTDTYYINRFRAMVRQ